MRRYLLLSVLLLPVLQTSAQYTDPSFPGGLDSLLQYLSNKVIFPAAALGRDGQLASVYFDVSKSGKISHVKAWGFAKATPYEEEMIRMVKEMPDWEPGTIRGKKTAMSYHLTGKFYLHQPEDSNAARAQTITIEQPPRFPGGEAGLSAYLESNISYPLQAAQQKTGGTVYVMFVIKSDGSIVDVKALGTALGYGLPEEAMRLVREMPRWQPGIQNGKGVNVQFTLPVRFEVPPPQVPR
ncbi:energy transducer TonB [Chitinophaga lutea]|uniref:Energy transducer TonB n=1 Tax=Chitinophaga lutea TaxID=2488634 RepID=A0A3N4PUI6_9BACT|nr:energy transducer TonB [Chitinophaga lutea]RPE12312.1 energy transducer TonB [Chitinophaga lutea]